MDEPIYFCEPEYYALSNFSAFMLEWKGVLWPTSEHAYQAEKFTDVGVKAKLVAARSVDEAYKVAQEHTALRRPDWDQVKVSIMKEIFKAKVEQHPIIREMLLASGDRVLIKNSPLDNYWGWGPHKDGENMMGKLWMEIREDIRT